MSVFQCVHMPSLDGATGWVKSDPLGPAELRGHVVLLNFWTLTCINWLRHEPYVRAWSQAYPDDERSASAPWRSRSSSPAPRRTRSRSGAVFQRCFTAAPRQSLGSASCVSHRRRCASRLGHGACEQPVAHDWGSSTACLLHGVLPASPQGPRELRHARRPHTVEEAVARPTRLLVVAGRRPAGAGPDARVSSLASV
jgi:hypothetical protein